jgi:mono/diheme cytochrome c family protein
MAGAGDGESAADLDPRPPSLTGMYDRQMRGMQPKRTAGHLMHGVKHHHPGITHVEAMGGLNLDAYTFWAVSEGGEPMGGSMPPFKDILSETERWQIMLYVANGFSVDGSR